MVVSARTRQPANLLRLFKAATKRRTSDEAYRSFQGIQAEMIMDYLRRQEVNLDSCLALDLGCGPGGYAFALEAEGATVISSDLLINLPADLAGEDLPSRLLQADATNLPFNSESLDFVFCASLIEHVPDGNALVREIARVLKPGGMCYLSYPPFYTPIGGHQFKPFHLLGQRFAVSLYKLTNRSQLSQQTSDFGDAFGAWGLYPRTISGVRRYLKAAQLEILDQSTRYLPLNFSKIPMLSEFMTWHVQFLLKKPLG